MQTLTEKEIIKKIGHGEIFSALIDSHAFVVKIDKYVPAVFTAIHDGHEIGSSFAEKMLVSAQERKFEEDPYTADFIEPFPVTLKVRMSRYNCDLNRPLEKCIYDVAWGRKVWRKCLSEKEQRAIRELHDSYYRVLGALLDVIEKRFSRCVLYDLHSYNFSRLEGDPPLFNIGTHYIDFKMYTPVLTHLQECLLSIELPEVENRVAFDEVFLGKGYQAAFIKQAHQQTLCIPLEIKKVFMDENTFVPQPLIFEKMLKGLPENLARNADHFAEIQW